MPTDTRGAAHEGRASLAVTTVYEVCLPGGRVCRFQDIAVARGFAAAQRLGGRRVKVRQRTIPAGGSEPEPPPLSAEARGVEGA